MIDQALIDALDRYVQHRVRTGSFLQAVLKNNLYAAVTRACLDNLRNLEEIVHYVSAHVPESSRGSHERVEDYLQKGHK